ncbi:hypothetical protein SAMN02910377_00712 [Pseudobutyrivibrio ruminis]|uniref:Uncharacterized protein n=1 Tax=Pseudobutyrivibrio ruminis TaxID=46206 RepID=A0A1H7GIK3_9FIRM|nr:hypothetical protein SAMN02910377_00712 [Pseudobutyrivibrio ruminis]
MFIHVCLLHTLASHCKTSERTPAKSSLCPLRKSIIFAKSCRGLGGRADRWAGPGLAINILWRGAKMPLGLPGAWEFEFILTGSTCRWQLRLFCRLPWQGLRLRHQLRHHHQRKRQSLWLRHLLLQLSSLSCLYRVQLLC